MNHVNRHPRTQGSRDPQLGGDRKPPSPTPELTGFEPLLGGLRRVGPDLNRIRALLEAPDEESRSRLTESIVRLGQSRAYEQELILVVPIRARHQIGNWRGTFTPPQRVAAIHTLAEIGSADSLGVLLAALADSIYEVRHAAEYALTAICRRLDPADKKTADSVKLMVTALGLLPMSARKVIARILAQFQPDLVMPPLLRDGLTSLEWAARRESVWILGMLGDIRATRRLIAVLEADPSETVRAAAAWALGRLDAPIAVSPLITAAAQADEIIRAAAVEALGEHAVHLDGQDEDFRPILEALLNRLKDKHWSVRQTAIEALSRLRQPEARVAAQQFLKR